MGFEICERHGRIRCCECAEIDDLRQRLAAAEEGMRMWINAAQDLEQRLASAEADLAECRRLLREACDYRRKRELPDREWLDQAQAALEEKL